MSNNPFETILGAFVIVAAGAFVAFAVSSADLKKVEGYSIQANFAQATGISSGNDVRISGVKVGSISKMTLNPQSYLAEITMSIEPEVKLPKDTVAKIATEGIFGSKYLALEPGGEFDNLQPGDTIQYTQGSVNLEELIGKFIFNGSGDSGSEEASPDMSF